MKQNLRRSLAGMNLTVPTYVNSSKGSLRPECSECRGATVANARWSNQIIQYCKHCKGVGLEPAAKSTTKTRLTV